MTKTTRYAKRDVSRTRRRPIRSEDLLNSVMTVVQCWDDGVTTDVRLVEILRKHKAKATFNLNAGLHDRQRKLQWIHKETEVWRLGWEEMADLYDGFRIANHTLTHPRLEQMPLDEARRNIVEGRERLQEFFGQSVTGFAYPFGTYNEAVMNLLRDTGHCYARTTRDVELPYPPEDPMAFHPCCHFLQPDLFARYQRAKEHGVFYFWGHSYEMVTDSMWADFEALIARISGDPESRWAYVQDLFATDVP